MRFDILHGWQSSHGSWPQKMGLGIEYENYPFLTREEFAEVCHYLDRRYRQATLGPIRLRWKLRVCNALQTSFALDADYSTYVQITRPLEAVLDYGDLSSQINGFTFMSETQADRTSDVDDRDMADMEDADKVLSLSARAEYPDTT
jgi:ubiquitin-like-conjugating enzyme ATG10